MFMPLSHYQRCAFSLLPSKKNYGFQQRRAFYSFGQNRQDVGYRLSLKYIATSGLSCIAAKSTAKSKAKGVRANYTRRQAWLVKRVSGNYRTTQPEAIRL